MLRPPPPKPPAWAVRTAVPCSCTRRAAWSAAPAATTAAGEMNTPEDLAAELNMSAKVLRGWLRRHHPRPTSSKWSRWELTDAQVRAAKEYWTRSTRKRRASAPQRLVKTPQLQSRSTSDEAYVIDLCDEILGETAERQHRFPWLRGDPGKGGRSQTLPIDAYYPRRQLVLEYHERQHYERVGFFDKESIVTVSGVHRGEQRQLYDARRKSEIPKRGMEYIVISWTDLDADGRGRLRRNRANDLKVLQRLLTRGNS